MQFVISFMPQLHVQVHLFLLLNKVAPDSTSSN